MQMQMEKLLKRTRVGLDPSINLNYSKINGLIFQVQSFF